MNYKNGFFLKIRRLAPLKFITGSALIVAPVAGFEPAKAAESVLYSFKSGIDGASPGSGLIFDSEGVLYGTTPYGGTSSGYGTVFKLTPPKPPATVWAETVLYRFRSGTDGANPMDKLVSDSNGVLYGTTSSGGLGYGTVFKLTPPTPPATVWLETILYSFLGGYDGSTPNAELTFDSNGALVGTTSSGGNSSYGTVFKLTPPCGGETQWSETILYNFKGGSDGSSPQTGIVIDSNGVLYGTTSSGGFGYGTVFTLKHPVSPAVNWTKGYIHLFASAADGQNPSGVLLDSEGSVYLTTTSGGAPGYGTVLKFSPPKPPATSWTETRLHNFNANGVDGYSPHDSLIFDHMGALYGTTSGGGATGQGTVYKLTPPTPPATIWTETILYGFKSSPDGAGPTARVIFDSNAALYGTTSYGGASGYGTVFKVQ